MTKTETPMPTAFDPQAVEAGWYARWEGEGLFVADASSKKPKATICLPPPNLTGGLHMGHALNHTLQDICARYRRMAGHEVLFLPGTDHAAIATQNVIEKQLAAEGMTKEQLGREAFESRVEEWYRDVGETIVSQDRILGVSLDWSRLRFTMDERYVRSVMTAFVAFYERGWIYRAPRIVNWCPRDRSAISDLEVKWQEPPDGGSPGAGAPPAGRGGPQGRRPPGEGRAIHPRGRSLRPLRCGDRAIDQRAMVAAHGGHARQGAAGFGRRQGAMASRALRAHLPRLASRTARLERGAPALARPSRP